MVAGMHLTYCIESVERSLLNLRLRASPGIVPLSHTASTNSWFQEAGVGEDLEEDNMHLFSVVNLDVIDL